MPLHYSDEEMDLLLELCRPIEPARSEIGVPGFCGGRRDPGEQASTAGPRYSPDRAAGPAAVLDAAAAGQRDTAVHRGHAALKA